MNIKARKDEELPDASFQGHKHQGWTSRPDDQMIISDDQIQGMTTCVSPAAWSPIASDQNDAIGSQNAMR